MKDIQNREDLVLLIDTFYGQVFQDPLIGLFFKHINFEEHKPHMVNFWAFALLSEAGYSTNVVEKHSKFRIKQEHLDRWLLIFDKTVNQLFQGETAEAAKQRARWVGWTIVSKSM